MERWEVLETTYNELKKYFNENVNRTLSIYALSNYIYISVGRTKIIPPLAYVIEVLRVMTAASYVMQLPYASWKISSEIPPFVDWKMVNKFAGDDACPLYIVYKDKEEVETKPEVTTTVSPDEPIKYQSAPKEPISGPEHIYSENDNGITLEEYRKCFLKKPTVPVQLPEPIRNLYYDEDNKSKFHLYILETFGKCEFKTSQLIEHTLEDAGGKDTFTDKELERLQTFVAARIMSMKQKNVIKLVKGSKRLLYLNIKWD